MIVTHVSSLIFGGYLYTGETVCPSLSLEVQVIVRWYVRLGDAPEG